MLVFPTEVLGIPTGLANTSEPTGTSPGRQPLRSYVPSVVVAPSMTYVEPSGFLQVVLMLVAVGTAVPEDQDPGVMYELLSDGFHQVSRSIASPTLQIWTEPPPGFDGHAVYVPSVEPLAAPLNESVRELVVRMTPPAPEHTARYEPDGIAGSVQARAQVDDDGVQP